MTTRELPLYCIKATQYTADLSINKNIKIGKRVYGCIRYDSAHVLYLKIHICIYHLLFYYNEVSIYKKTYIKERIADFRAFKEEVGMNKTRQIFHCRRRISKM